MGLRDRLLKTTSSNQIKPDLQELMDEDFLSDEQQDSLEEIVNFSPEEETKEKDQDYLTEHEKKYQEQILKKLFEAVDMSRIGKLEKDEARIQIKQLVETIINENDFPLSMDSRIKMVQVIEDEILGLGPLEFLMRDKRVSEIMVNGAKQIFIEKSGKLQLSNVVFDDDTHAMRVIDRIVSRVGRRIDESSPMADARLEDGSRVNIIIPPLALDGPIITIRRFPSDPLTLNTLVEKNALSIGMATFLKAVVKVGKNIVISGGTGSGKTTALNALSAFIPSDERIVTIEDAAELQLQQEHLVRLETRPANIEGNGEIGQRELVKNALRMRPDRIVVGEVRGAEAMDMLQAMNTGHDGSLTTTHANTPRDALARLENLVAMGGFELPIKAVRAQIASAVDYIVQVQRLEDGSRRMTYITEINGMEGEIITLSDIFVFERRGLSKDNKIVGVYKPTGAMPACMDALKRRGIELDPDFFDPENEVEA